MKDLKSDPIETITVVGLVIIGLLTISFAIYGYLAINPEVEEVPEEIVPSISTTPTNYQLKRMSMLSVFMENCRLDRYPEWRCMVFAKLGGFSDEEITKNSRE